MKVIAVNCSGCGAPLEVGRKATWVTCNFCESKLKIEHGDNATWTELAEELRDELKALKTDRAVERLDREWERERQGYMLTDKRGRQSIPSEGTATVMAVLMGLMSIVPFTMASGMPSHMSRVPTLMGFFMIGAAVFMWFTTVSKAQKYTQAKARYQRRRRELARGESAAGDSAEATPARRR